MLAVAVAAGGGSYLHGLMDTTLDRPSGGFPAARLLVLSGTWLWVVAVPAALGLVAAVTARRGRRFALLGVVLFAALLLAPAEQAYIHTYTSLYKHAAYGAWFGCALAGYALASLSTVVPAAKAIAAFRVGVIAVAAAALPGIPAATRQYHSWPDSTAPDRGRGTGHRRRIQARSSPTTAARCCTSTSVRRSAACPWTTPSTSATAGRAQRQPEHGLAGYADAIRHRYFAVVVLQFTDNLAVDDQIWHDLSTSGNYHIPAAVRFPTPLTGSSSSTSGTRGERAGPVRQGQAPPAGRRHRAGAAGRSREGVL